MKFELYNIIPALTPYVKVISSIENPGKTKSTFRVLPDTCVELFLNYSSNKIANIKTYARNDDHGSFVTSRMSTFMDVQLLPDSGSIAICFVPGAAYNFFNIPMSELIDQNIDLADLWGSRANELEEQISQCSHNLERISVIQSFLTALLRNRFENNSPYKYCLWQINLHKGQVPVNTFSKKINISQRQLSRQFKTFLGISPKEYSRITRFIFCLQNLTGNMRGNLTHIAYESGYYDQSHFIHDCRQFTGLTPKGLIASENVVY